MACLCNSLITVCASPPAGFQPNWLAIGNVRMRLPVAANSALHSAGDAGGNPGSPSPPTGASLSMKCTSIAGAAASFSTG